MMLNRLILKVTKFQLPPPKRLGTVVKNILGGHHAPPPCQIGLMTKLHLFFMLFALCILDKRQRSQYNEVIDPLEIFFRFT